MSRLSISTATSSSNYPATSNNRTIRELKREIASYAGGITKDTHLNRAGQALQRAHRSFDVWAWDFNILSQDITIPGSPASGNSEYNLSASFHSPVRAVLLDSSSYPREDIQWVPWAEWVTFDTDQSTTSAIPEYYTIRNVHEVGRVTLAPPPASSVTWPTVRIYYHRRIVWPTADSDKLQIPLDVEEAMFEMAVGHFIAQDRSAREGAAYLRDFFQPLMTQVQERWRSYKDIPAWGA